MAMTGSSTTVGPEVGQALHQVRRPGPGPGSPRPCARPAPRVAGPARACRRSAGGVAPWSCTLSPRPRPSATGRRHVEAGHRADHDGGRRREVDVGQVGQVGAHHLLAVGGAPVDDGHRRGRRPGRRPAAARRWSARAPMPIRTTSVPSSRPSASQSTPGSAGSPAWPGHHGHRGGHVRWVTGMPAAAGAAKAELTPGTTSTSTPARRSASASSPPRPKTNGSPPFRRTTRRPDRP